ncbi:hypothetical protein C5S31_10475 [ANME-1 cluster archaeon GoMg2]|nr:hypothetical protein [ANME-1 cluster archaeon GoMg2]
MKLDRQEILVRHRGMDSEDACGKGRGMKI